MFLVKRISYLACNGQIHSFCPAFHASRTTFHAKEQRIGDCSRSVHESCGRGACPTLGSTKIYAHAFGSGFRISIQPQRSGPLNRSFFAMSGSSGGLSFLFNEAKQKSFISFSRPCHKQRKDGMMPAPCCLFLSRTSRLRKTILAG